MTLATEADAIREWAWNVGYEDHYINQQWICSNYDTWERNPHYTGPEQAHPESEDYYYEQEAEAERIALQNKKGIDMVWLKYSKPENLAFAFRNQPEWEPCRKNCVSPWGILGPVRDGFWDDMGTEIPF